MPRYRFDNFVLSPRRRVLLHAGREQPLIPRYFDLLVFLVERRHEAVHRREIFDQVWRDVIVSESALTQAIRTIRRTLGDDTREPRFIRTMARHGYRFVYADVVEESDEADIPPAASVARDAVDRPRTEPPAHPTAATTVSAADPFEPLLRRLCARADSDEDEDGQRDAAGRLHELGTTDALDRLGTRPGHARARALLRDARWDVARAGPVPLLGQPGAMAAAAALVRLRVRRTARIVATRWVGAALGGSLAGVVAGVTGGWLLSVMPGSDAPAPVAVVLGLVGGACGMAGGAGVGAGLSLAEAAARSRRAAVLILGAALGGMWAGAVVQWVARWTLAAIVGLHVAVGGALEGVIIGMAAGTGYAAATRGASEGLAAPRGARRLWVVLATAMASGLGALGLALAGRPLVGGTIHAIAEASQGAQVLLTPFGALLGEPGFGWVTQVVLGFGEGLIFGAGLALGHTRRISRNAHSALTSP